MWKVPLPAGPSHQSIWGLLNNPRVREFRVPKNCISDIIQNLRPLGIPSVCPTCKAATRWRSGKSGDSISKYNDRVLSKNQALLVMKYYIGTCVLCRGPHGT